jgi:hypothetical protein
MNERRKAGCMSNLRVHVSSVSLRLQALPARLAGPAGLAAIFFVILSL